MEFFEKNPKRDLPHKESVKWVTAEYLKRTGQVFADADRQIRALHQKGYFIKVKKGVYRYDPKHVKNTNLQDFTAAQKKKILERDGYKCVICGKGNKDGVTLHIDHIKPKDLGGEATIDNGQVLCGPHNMKKKNYKQTETGKKMFIRLYELSKKVGDLETMEFSKEILEVFEKNDINGHIEWNR
jgi:hypothetical protein